MKSDRHYAGEKPDLATSNNKNENIVPKNNLKSGTNIDNKKYTIEGMHVKRNSQTRETNRLALSHLADHLKRPKTNHQASPPTTMGEQ